MSRKIKLSPFSLKVYKVILKIPLGQVRTYKWVAKKIGKPKAFRAVGQVLKHNPLPLIIPCHRVVSSDKKIGGYIWGKRIKKKILDYERKISKLMV